MIIKSSLLVVFQSHRITFFNIRCLHPLLLGPSNEHKLAGRKSQECVKMCCGSVSMGFSLHLSFVHIYRYRSNGASRSTGFGKGKFITALLGESLKRNQTAGNKVWNKTENQQSDVLKVVPSPERVWGEAIQGIK